MPAPPQRAVPGAAVDGRWLDRSLRVVGDDPGIGVEFDPAALAKYGTKVL